MYISSLEIQISSLEMEFSRDIELFLRLMQPFFRADWTRREGALPGARRCGKACGKIVSEMRRFASVKPQIFP